MAQPYNVDLAAQAAQTAEFQSIVEQTMAANNQAKGIADSAMTANQGSFSVAFQRWMQDIDVTATMNNQLLQSIQEALGFGIKSTTGTEEGNAASMSALTGLGGSFSSGSHFN